jgi:hypothetical protein
MVDAMKEGLTLVVRRHPGLILVGDLVIDPDE